MKTYKHTQIGKDMIIIFTILLAIFFLWSNTTAYVWMDTVMFISIMSVVFILLLFGSLTVSVNQSFIKIKFGIGLIRKKWPITEIETVKVVRNKWWYGLGIHMTPYGWLYNVSCLDALQVQLKNGGMLRIGTNQPHELKRAIIDQIGKMG